MKDRIILKLKLLITATELEKADGEIEKIAKNNKLIGLYEALNAVYDLIIEEIK